MKLTNIFTIALLAGAMIFAGCGPKDETAKTGKGDGDPTVKTPTVKTPVTKTGRAKTVVLGIKIPKAMFKGTPVPMSEENIAAGRKKGEKRPEIKVPVGTVNLALNKKVTSNESLPVVGDLEMVTDGDKSGEDGHNVDIGFGKKWVAIDLGEKANISGISVWHYHGQARAYRDVIVEVADDEDFLTNAKTVFNSDHNNSYGMGMGTQMGYVETNEGRYIYCPKGTTGRFVRLHSFGNTSNDQNHYIEVEVYGQPIK